MHDICQRIILKDGLISKCKWRRRDEKQKLPAHRLHKKPERFNPFTYSASRSLSFPSRGQALQTQRPQPEHKASAHFRLSVHFSQAVRFQPYVSAAVCRLVHTHHVAPNKSTGKSSQRGKRCRQCRSRSVQDTKLTLGLVDVAAKCITTTSLIRSLRTRSANDRRNRQT